MSVMVHATSLYGPRDTPDEVALSFLQADHPAIAMMWTPRAVLRKTFKSDTALFVQQLQKARASPFNDTMKMSRYWNEYDEE
jgi:hypothetical protein